jgi:hypothetical protein
MTLRDYFGQTDQVLVLDKYGRFACAKDWTVREKMDMYDDSRRAFDPTAPDLKSFESIYRHLQGWQVFRGSSPDFCWSPSKIFETTKMEFAQFAWGGPVTLANLMSSGKKEELLSSLTKMRDIKPNSGYPIMAVSKFLHFYNPALFPIYDNMVIWEHVFKRFNSEFRQFCLKERLGYDIGFTALFLRNYICWASSLVAAAHPMFMETFVRWLDKQPGADLSKRKFDASTLCATAFEFTAIGAAEAELASKAS